MNLRTCQAQGQINKHVRMHSVRWSIEYCTLFEYITISRQVVCEIIRQQWWILHKHVCTVRPAIRDTLNVSKRWSFKRGGLLSEIYCRSVSYCGVFCHRFSCIYFVGSTLSHPHSSVAIFKWHGALIKANTFCYFVTHVSVPAPLMPWWNSCPWKWHMMPFYSQSTTQ